MIKKIILSPFKIFDFVLNRIIIFITALLVGQTPFFLNNYLEKIIINGKDFSSNQINNFFWGEKFVIFFKNFNIDLFKTNLSNYNLKASFSFDFLLYAGFGLILGSILYFLLKIALISLLRNLILPERNRSAPLPRDYDHS